MNPILIPAEFYPIVGPEKLQDTAGALAYAADQIIEKRDAKNLAAVGRKELASRIHKLETEITLAEATAFMSHIAADGKTGTLPNGQSFPLNNEMNRDVFRRLHSADLRKALAEAEGELKAIDVDYYQAKDDWESAIKYAETLQGLARKQAELLRLLAAGAAAASK